MNQTTSIPIIQHGSHSLTIQDSFPFRILASHAFPQVGVGPLETQGVLS